MCPLRGKRGPRSTLSLVLRGAGAPASSVPGVSVSAHGPCPPGAPTSPRSQASPRHSVQMAIIAAGGSGGPGREGMTPHSLPSKAGGGSARSPLASTKPPQNPKSPGLRHSESNRLTNYVLVTDCYYEGDDKAAWDRRDAWPRAAASTHWGDKAARSLRGHGSWGPALSVSCSENSRQEAAWPRAGCRQGRLLTVLTCGGLRGLCGAFVRRTLTPSVRAPPL